MNKQNIFTAFLKSIIFARRSNLPGVSKFSFFKTVFTLFLKSKLFSNKRDITQRIFNFDVSAYDYKTLLYLFNEIFSVPAYYFKSEKSNPNICDCGANIGMSVLFFKLIYPNATIMAFEPNPNAFALLEKNIKQNNLSNVTLHNVAVSNDTGTLDFYFNDNKASLMGSIVQARGGVNKISVEAKKLTDFFTDERLDLMKIDIEGAEDLVLENLVAENKLSFSDRYIIEYHHKIQSRKSALSSFIIPFEQAGFEYNLKSYFKNLDQMQDILIYCYKNPN